MSDDRPSPDAILAALSREKGTLRGHLKIFLGMAPGVGKTYTMLESARGRAMSGEDVVIAVAETHGRTETAELLLGLEILPRSKVEYGGITLEEMDIDALLLRRPLLAVVDELAHTNAPGSRHSKRYLDVEELLANGTDVFTTVNIQHLESLNDAVAQIAGVRVRETIPDRILERADEVELVDLPVDELMERLREGKVYVPAQAQRAIAGYFREGNLAALRQLALRYVAERVDRQMHTYMRAHAIPGPWPTAERLLVSVSPSPLSPRLVRATRRMAERRHADWIAAYVETPRHARMSDADRSRIASTLRLAEEMGARTVTLLGSDVAAEMLRYAQQQNVTEIVVGKSFRSWWFELLRGSVVSRIIRNSGSIDVYVVTGDDESLTGFSTPAKQHEDTRQSSPHIFWRALAAVAVAGLVAALLRPTLSLPNLSIVFLLAVLFSAVRWGLRASIVASIVSALAFNFFFVEPFHTFNVASPDDLLMLAMYLIVAVLTSNLAGRIRDQAQIVRAREARTAALYDLSQRIAGEMELNAIAQAIVADMARNLVGRAVLLVPGGEGLEVRASYPSGIALGPAEYAAATWTLHHNRDSGRGTETLPGDRWTYVPLSVGDRPVGAIALDLEESTRMLDSGQRRFLEAYADLAAVAIERVRMTTELESVRLLSERERLQALMLSSISHDLRTPLSSIIGSATSLLEGGDHYDTEARTELAQTILEEGERLNRFIGNLLDTTRLESGSLELSRDWIEIGDVVGAALRSLAHRLSKHNVAVVLADDLPLVFADFVLVEHVLINIFDNAGKFSPDGTAIAVRVSRESQAVFIAVEDDGIGIPESDLARVFDKFYRVSQSDQRPAGTGLGLSICRGIMEEHGGSIVAESPINGDRGTRVILRFPLLEPTPPIEPDFAQE